MSYFIFFETKCKYCIGDWTWIFIGAAGNATFMEHIVLMVVIAIPIFGTSMMGYGSTSLVYGYVLIFDYLRCLGHCNVEIVPHKWFEAFPFLKYVIYTPT